MPQQIDAVVTILAASCCNLPTMNIRLAQHTDLPRIVVIYNASIPSRMATADTDPVSVSDREAWFAEFAASGRPLWVVEDALTGVYGWLSLRAFYGRPAYRSTVEVAVYVAPERQHRGAGRRLLSHAI